MRNVLVLLLAALALTGCASRAAKRVPPGVPVDSRPTPPPPPAENPAPADTARPTVPAPNSPPAPEPQPPPVESVITPDERRQTLARIVADTTAAGSSVRRCAGRTLLPDQESVFDTARSLLGQARAALERDELWRAESLARKARQLAASLNCPG
jgi:type IV secretory pathway VirB10-like protein